MRTFVYTVIALVAIITPITTSNPAVAETIYVPADYATIREAVLYSNQGDTVLVAPGTYEENINVFKEITVISEGGPEETVITASPYGSAVNIMNPLYHQHPLVEGFTITGSTSSGVHINGGAPVIRNCVITGNTATHGGGGIVLVDESVALIENCMISGNTVQEGDPFEGGYGGGLYIEYSSPTILNCTISGNTAPFGGALYCNGSSPMITNSTIVGNVSEFHETLASHYSDLKITNCVITENTAINGDVVSFRGGVSVLQNTILWNNPLSPQPGGYLIRLRQGVLHPAPTLLTITFSDVEGGNEVVHVEDPAILEWNSNIDANPFFVGVDDFHLGEWSPCIDAGDPTTAFDDLDDSQNDMGIWGGPGVDEEWIYDGDGDNFGNLFWGPDCDDTDPEVHPYALEICDDGIDNNCDGFDEGSDDDDDGFLDEVCWWENDDCDDLDATVYPGADEICDGLDNDCSGNVDIEERDVDGDGWMVCEGDCDDSPGNPGGKYIHPGALELCDGIDNNCDGVIDEGCICFLNSSLH